MTDILDILAAILAIVGGLFTVVGAYGLVKLNDPLSRLHAPTKASTMGVGCIIAAALLHNLAIGEPTLREALIMGFIFVTAPVSAHFIAKSNIHHRRDIERLPTPKRDKTWAVLSATDVTGRDDMVPETGDLSTPQGLDARSGG